MIFVDNYECHMFGIEVNHISKNKPRLARGALVLSSFQGSILMNM